MTTGTFFVYFNPIPPIPASIELALQEMSELTEDWDSYGARPISPSAINTAREIIAWSNNSENYLQHIGPLASGGVLLQWEKEHTDEKLIVAVEESISYLLVRSIQEERTYEEHNDVAVQSVIAEISNFITPLGGIHAAAIHRADIRLRQALQTHQTSPLHEAWQTHYRGISQSGWHTTHRSLSEPSPPLIPTGDHQPSYPLWSLGGNQPPSWSCQEAQLLSGP